MSGWWLAARAAPTLAVGLVVSFAAHAAARHAAAPKEKVTVRMTPAEFEKVKLNTSSESPCTPKVDEDEFRGLRIAAPDRIELGDDTPFLVCGIVQAKNSALYEFYNPDFQLTLVVVDSATHRVFAGNLRDPHSEVVHEMRAFNPSSPQFDTAVLTFWFNPDLRRYIEGLPMTPGKYFVWAYLGTMVSNVVVVELAKPGPTRARP